MTLRLEGVAVDGVFLGLRREVAEMHRLARIGPDAGGDEHQPRQQLAALLVRLGRQELAGLLGEIEQDRVAVEDGRVAVDDRRHLGVGIDRQELRRVLLALAGVDRHQLVGQRHLLQAERDLGRVRREVVVELDHGLHSLSPEFTVYAAPQEENEESAMGRRLNRAIELLEADQAIYYDGPHTGHVLTYDQGRADARTWADYINVGMEHGAST